MFTALMKRLAWDPRAGVAVRLLSSQENTYTYRSHTCGELRSDHVGDIVRLCGWLHFKRMDSFAVLRDAYGSTQIVFPPHLAKLGQTPLESVISVKGKVVARPETQINKRMDTGEVEVVAEEVEVLNEADKTLPFTIRDGNKANENIRMRYRYLDLRFPSIQKTLRFRSSLFAAMRRFLTENRSFVEVETPTLFKKTPGGAQEFVVPTQFPGQFYSLVQSPQQLKQLLMVGGVDRYFQFARCYRDETSRPDRQPEFTQVVQSFSSSRPMHTEPLEMI